MPSTKIACTKVLGFQKIFYVLSQFCTTAEPYVLDSFSGVPQVQMFFGDYCLNPPQVQNCLFFLAITVGGATKGCATRLGNSRATNRIYLLNDNKYTQTQKDNHYSCLSLTKFARLPRVICGAYTHSPSCLPPTLHT